MPPVVPTGTVTFLFTDVEGSTARWEADPEAMTAAMRRHDQIVRGHIEAHSGHVFATGGDSFSAAFARIGDAIHTATAAQKALAAEDWPSGLDIAVRMGLHTGEADERGGDYFGSAVNRAARVADAGHGGQVLLSDVTAALVEDLEVIDLGAHLLKSLDAPIGLRQLVIDGHRREFPPLRTVGTTSSTIRPPRNELVGRRDLVERTLAALRDGRLVSLTGAGGAGKTRLALEVGNALVATVPGGVYFVDLSKVTDEELIVPTLAEGVGLAMGGSIAASEAVRRHLATRQALVVIDNCEHLIDDVADVVDELLADCPHIVVLTTSREALGLEGETVLRLPGMPDDEALTLFSRVAGRDEASWSDDERTAIGDICRRLDGLPLAIELAAARTSVLSVAEIAANLDDRFSLLTGGRRRTRGRSQTLLAAVQWSYDLLAPHEQRALAALSVMPGSFGLELAHRVLDCSVVAAAALLDDLAARSLIQANPDAADHHDRYRLLETIRVFAADQLAASGSETDVRDRHLAAVADLIGVKLQMLAATTEQARLGEDALVAYDWARRNDDVAAGCRLAQVVTDTLLIRGAYERCDEVLEWVTTIDDPQTAAWMWAMGVFQGVWRLDAPLIRQRADAGVAAAPGSIPGAVCGIMRAAGYAWADPIRSLAEFERFAPVLEAPAAVEEYGSMIRFTPTWARFGALMWADRIDEAVEVCRVGLAIARDDQFWLRMTRGDLLTAMILAGDRDGLAELLNWESADDRLATAAASAYSARCMEGAAMAHSDRLVEGRRHIATQWADRPDDVVPDCDHDVAIALAECALVDGEPDIARRLLDACGYFARHQGSSVLMYRRRAELAGIEPSERPAWWADEVTRRFLADQHVDRTAIVTQAINDELTRLGLR